MVGGQKAHQWDEMKMAWQVHYSELLDTKQPSVFTCYITANLTSLTQFSSKEKKTRAAQSIVCSPMVEAWSQAHRLVLAYKGALYENEANKAVASMAKDNGETVKTRSRLYPSWDYGWPCQDDNNLHYHFLDCFSHNLSGEGAVVLLFCAPIRVIPIIRL